MSDNLKKCMSELQRAMRIKHRPSRKAVLNFLAKRKCVYKALQEISTNIINRNIPLSKDHIRRLNPHTKTIKGLLKGTKNKRSQQRLVNQSGGFIHWLLPLVATALSA